MSKRLVMACDHGGIDLKNAIKAQIEADFDFEVFDLGTHDHSSVNYTDYAHALAEDIGTNGGLGILVCGTGIGMSMAANRHPHIRAAVCTDAYCSKMTRQHNDANVLCLGGRVIGIGLALDIVSAFLTTRFEGGRHQKRVQMLTPGSK